MKRRRGFLAIPSGRSFFRITLPLASRGLVAGTMPAFAWAMGDFGATLVIAGNIQGKIQIAAMAVFDAVQVGSRGINLPTRNRRIGYLFAARLCSARTRSLKSAPRIWPMLSGAGKNMPVLDFYRCLGWHTAELIFC